jgi:nitroimidazol reductase NimA-like FMN-containing flavoprotein (pyridoxamine 5'-phosphate oxidase superfamily)
MELTIFTTMKKMRRAEKQVNDIQVIEDIIAKADVIRIGLLDGSEPYIVPLNFGYQAPYFYMHCANKGRKIEIIKKNPFACFEIDTDHNLVTDKLACGWSMQFKSVMGTGTMEILTNENEKIDGLTILMNQYHPKGLSKPYDFTKLIGRTTVLRLRVEKISCKVNN